MNNIKGNNTDINNVTDLEDMNRFLVSTSFSNEEISYDTELRPRNFHEFIGQRSVVDNIELMINSALIRKQPMDHVLFSGPPGLGKTSLAYLMAKILGVNLHVVTGPAVDKKGDLAATLTNLSPRDVLFIDEIHRLPTTVEEMLYSAMEDFRLDIIIGHGPSARTMQIQIPPFTLIGATTRSGLLSRPLRDRFTSHMNFDFYNSNELGEIIIKNAQKMSVKLAPKSALLIATMARGTPRVANRILRRVRDFSIVKKVEEMDENDVTLALKLLGIDCYGLDAMDRKILSLIDEQYKGGPVGIDALCATLCEDRHTIEDVYEPYLLKIGFLLRTSRGRVISDKAKEYLNQSKLKVNQTSGK